MLSMCLVFWRSLGSPVGLQGSQGNPGFGNPPPICVTWSGHNIQGHIVQVRHFPRDGTSKGWNVQEPSFGDTSIGDRSSWHRWFLPLVTSHTPMAGRGGTSGTFAAKSSTLYNKDIFNFQR